MSTSKVSITFTGADGNTRGSDVCLIAECARECGVDVEMALLWSRNNGRERYPSGNMSRALWNRITGEGLRCAVHMCGEVADRVLQPGKSTAKFLTMRTDVADELASLSTDDDAAWLRVLHSVTVANGKSSRGRVQVNVRAGERSPSPATLLAVREGIAKHLDSKCPMVVGQHRGGVWPSHYNGVAWLFDQSGGRGVTLDAWPDLPDYPVGLAGGLGPSYSAAEAARRLAARAGGWVDMESRIRTDGRLDPALCCRVIREVAAAIS